MIPKIYYMFYAFHKRAEFGTIILCHTNFEFKSCTLTGLGLISHSNRLVYICRRGVYRNHKTWDSLYLTDDNNSRLSCHLEYHLTFNTIIPTEVKFVKIHMLFRFACQFCFFLYLVFASLWNKFYIIPSAMIKINRLVMVELFVIFYNI